MTEPGLGPEQAWLGRVEWSEERTTRKAPLKCYTICSYSRPLMAGDGKFHAQGRGCEPLPEGQDDRHQHRGSRFGPPASHWLSDKYSISVFQSVGFTGVVAGHRKHPACNSPARKTSVASTFQRGQ